MNIRLNALNQDRIYFFRKSMTNLKFNSIIILG